MEIPPIELPDDAIKQVMGIYGVALEMATDELFKRGYVGWGTFMAIHFALINDVLGVRE